MWTLLDYNAWSNMGPDDVPNLGDDQATDFWPEVNDFCNTFPHFDLGSHFDFEEVFQGTATPLLP